MKSIHRLTMLILLPLGISGCATWRMQTASEIETEIAAAAVHLDAGQKIEASHVKLVKRFLNNIPLHSITTLDRVIGRKTLKSLEQGEIITSDLLVTE